MRTIPSAWPYVTAAAIGLAAVTPFVDFDGALVFDPDLRIDEILAYHGLFADGSLRHLTPPAPNVYFEGHSFIYGLGLHLYQAACGLLGLKPPLREAAIATVGIVGSLAHVAATVVFYATVRRLTQNNVTAILLAAFFGLSPQILNIDLIRIDRLMILPLVVVMHVCILIARREATRRDGILLGIAMAVLSATKISGAFFGVMPVLAAAIVLAQDRDVARAYLRRLAAASLTAGVPVLAILMVRHLLHWRQFPAGLAEGYAMQMKWTSVLPSTPRLYYNIDLFAGYGTAFLLLVAAAVAVVAVRAIAERDATALWLLVCLALFSAAGVAVFKYDRGGYHLVPLYLFALAIMIRTAMDLAGGRLHLPRLRREALVGLFVLAVPAVTLGRSYASQTHQALLRDISVQQTRLASRDWILANFSAGERICMMTSSQWANPQLAGHGFQVTTAPLDIPYLDGAAMADYVAPRLDQLRAACDAVVLNDLHNTVYLNNFSTRGYTSRRAEWDRLLGDLERVYPAKIFQGAVTSYFVSRVEIYDLRATTPETPLPSRTEILAGAFDGAAITAGGRRMTLTGGFGGAVDVVARTDDGRVAAEGWAIDAAHQEPVAGIVLVAGSRIIGYGGTGTARRADVAAVFEAPEYQLSGYAVCAPALEGRLRVFALSRDGRAGELATPEGTDATATPRRPPYPCLSFDTP